MAGRRVTQAEYARRRGITRTAVFARTRKGGGPIPTYGARNMIDPVEADALWTATMTPSGYAQSQKATDDSLTAAADPAVLKSATELARARADVMLAEAELRRLRLDERRGQLLDRDAALDKFFRALRAVRDAWLAWPARVGAELAAELRVEPAALMIVLDRYVRRQLAELADAVLDLGDVASKSGPSSSPAEDASTLAEGDDDADGDDGSRGARRDGRARAAP